MLSLLSGIGTNHTTEVIGPGSKIVYGNIQIGIANNIYDKLMNDKKNTPTTYKTSCLLDTGASGDYGDNITKVQKKKTIQPGLGINIRYADKEILSQIGEGKLTFDNIPKSTEDVQLFNDMHSPLFEWGNFQKRMHISLWQTHCACY